MTSVLVVDDSQFMRTVIGNILADHGYEVYRASNGERAVEAVREHSPDIVTMDVQMPEMDGIEAVDRIMTEYPTRILMLSAHTEDGADATLRALASGAIDFLEKPSGEVSTDIAGLEDRLIDAITAVEDAHVASLARSRTAASARRVAGGVETPTGTSSRSADPADMRDDRRSSTWSDATADEDRTYLEHPTIVIGASTGGPKVIERLLCSLPLDLDARVLIIQHMPPEFTVRLAKRLDDRCAYRVKEADDGDRISGGEVLVAHGDRHMVVAHSVAGRSKVRLTDDDPVNGVRPSIDVTMESVAETVEQPVVGIALTGMGKDGAAGIRAIKDAGGTTIAQDEGTSPVFGIPRQAIATGAVDHVLPAERITDGVLDSLSTEVTTHG
ncbi:chemotaxis-specific protein-glutamate methyltransferase CheB [Natranaeroarchaeum aerophilus]|uniref:Protein-glutamate methylesterase/protein-glutamine glutaminase n=1 Tax=Natranaeroarchaeum aerophilus TaxID=2917711 RepID=A0AAE3K6M2_9EURY|nr:chemotaxis-specific protein-glutamate methyltransferase CheB [Natranaeroarchaeum aerophilus]MCL9815128.1 chemotaxis-specific protein-glutamate methyltransferase CheB [Natranaeroarchaeum aerophilus]